jgi:ABC-2 type transport system ATP-binding protein
VIEGVAQVLGGLWTYPVSTKLGLGCFFTRAVSAADIESDLGLDGAQQGVMACGPLRGSARLFLGGSEVGILEVSDLRKQYGSIPALKGISFTVGVAERVVVLGPNGSGKTTTLDILGGFLRPTAGWARVLGAYVPHLPPGVRRQMGFVFQDKAGLYPELTVRETLELFGGYYPDPLPAPELLEKLGLADRRDRWVRNLSGGERRRLELAVALLGRPRLIFLDEPTASLDPEARLLIWALIEELADRGVTFVLTTHNLEEARRLGRRVLLLRGGELIFDGSPQTMIAQAGLPYQISFRRTEATLPPALAVRARVEGDRVTLPSLRPDEDLMALRGSGVGLEEVSIQPPTLEEAYLALLKGASHEHHSPNAVAPSLAGQ